MKKQILIRLHKQMSDQKAKEAIRFTKGYFYLLDKKIKLGIDYPFDGRKDIIDLVFYGASQENNALAHAVLYGYLHD